MHLELNDGIIEKHFVLVLGETVGKRMKQIKPTCCKSVLKMSLAAPKGKNVEYGLSQTF